MKSTLFTLLLSFAALYSFAQKDTIHIEEPVDTLEIEIPETPCDVYVEPQFPGGEKAMFAYVIDNLSYQPENLTGDPNEWTAYVEFYIETNGEVTNVKCLRGSDELCNAFMDVVRMMPKWTPAMHCGVAKRERFVLPIFLKPG